MVRQRLGVRGMAALRAANESLMPDCCTITHVVPGTPVPGGDGTETTGDVTTTTTVACRVMALTEPVEQEIAARLQGTTGFEIEMPYDTIVAEQDTITYLGTVLQVIGAQVPVTFQKGVTLLAKRIS